ncbi:transporter [Gilliamella apis]|uniref:transporter n=1 Tax=Gilliamella apis TaxID=1970738 RepID=UPI003AAD5194
MAIGAGIVFLPIQVGLKGLWVFLLSILITYPAIYLLQRLYLKTLSEAEECSDYANVINQYLGPNWAILLGFAYFLMQFKGILFYSIAVTYDSASYLQTFGITDNLMSDHFWWGLLVLSIVVAIASRGERLLFKVSGPMVVVKLGIVIIIGIIMIPHWSFSNIPSFPQLGSLIRDTFLTLPFTLFSILFVQILSPMNVAYRKVESNKKIATYRAIRTHRIAYTILAVSVLLFAFSFSFTLSHEQAQYAYEQNITALALAAKVLPDSIIKIMSITLNIFAVLTAFFGIFLGFQEALKGIIRNILIRFIPKDKINERFLSIFVCLFAISILWLIVMTKISFILLTQIGAPLNGIITCLIPCFLVYKVPALHKFKGISVYYVMFMGIMLCCSPFFKFFE